jgi:hypothetical protein
MPFCNGRDTTKNTRERHLTRETMDELRRADDGRVVIRAKEMEMGNDSTGTEETHINPGSSPALFVRETYQLLLSYHNDSYWCASTRKLESTISNARTRTVMSSTGTPDAVKVACPVWMRGKSASSYLCIRNCPSPFAMRSPRIS